MKHCIVITAIRIYVDSATTPLWSGATFDPGPSGVFCSDSRCSSCSRLASDAARSLASGNVGARSVWLHFETAEEREKSPPALRELCEHLLGAACGAACGL